MYFISLRNTFYDHYLKVQIFLDLFLKPSLGSVSAGRRTEPIVWGLTWYLLLPKLFGFGIPPILHLECPQGGFLYSIWYKNILLPHLCFLALQYQWFSTPGPCQKVMLGKRLMELEKPNYHIVFYILLRSSLLLLLSRLKEIKCDC